jgi:hypothetical protein
VYLYAWRRRNVARRGRGEDLDVMPALSLADREPVRGISCTARIRRERRGQVSDPQVWFRGWTKGGHPRN